jgi:hypothetical protein
LSETGEGSRPAAILDAYSDHASEYDLERHFTDLEPAARSECFAEIREAMRGLETDAGVALRAVPASADSRR